LEFANQSAGLMSGDNFRGFLKLSSAKQTPNREGVERAEFKKAYVSISLQSIDMMRL